MLALCPGMAEANAVVAHAVHAAARTTGARVFEIGLDQRCDRPAAVHARKQQGRGRFQHGKWRTAQKVGESHENHFLAAADSERKAGIRIKLDSEARRPTVAAEACKHALEESGASGNKGIFVVASVGHANHSSMKMSAPQDPYWTH